LESSIIRPRKTHEFWVGVQERRKKDTWTQALKLTGGSQELASTSITKILSLDQTELIKNGKGVPVEEAGRM